MGKRERPEFRVGDARGSNDLDGLAELTREGNRVSELCRVGRHFETECCVGSTKRSERRRKNGSFGKRVQRQTHGSLKKIRHVHPAAPCTRGLISTATFSCPRQFLLIIIRRLKTKIELNVLIK